MYTLTIVSAVVLSIKCVICFSMGDYLFYFLFLQVLGREQQAQQRVYSLLTAQLREGTRILSKVYSNNHQLK